MENFNRYVAGFLFSTSSIGDLLLLVRKGRPPWQYGLLNAIGGSIEIGESSEEAMLREFKEETDIKLNMSQGGLFCREIGPDHAVEFYAFFHEGNPPEVSLVNDVGEAIDWWILADLPYDQCVGNLRWLIPLAMDWRRPMAKVSTSERITERPSW